MDTKKILIALAASVALNFFFIGFGVSRLTCPHTPEAIYAKNQKPPFEKGFFNPHHKGFESVFFKMSKENKKEMHAYRKKIKEAGKEIKKEILSEDFDEDRLKDALAKASDMRREIDEKMREVFLKTIKAMTPEERREFAENFEKKQRPDHKRHMKPWHEKRPPCPFAKKRFEQEGDRYPRHHNRNHPFPRHDERPCMKGEMPLPPPPYPAEPQVDQHVEEVPAAVQEPEFFHKEVVIFQEVIPEEKPQLTEEQRQEIKEKREKKRAEYRKMREKKRAWRRAERERRLKEQRMQEEQVKE